MEKDLKMYSTELIKNFPKEPKNKIYYVVYNEEMIPEAKFLIEIIWGKEYLDDNVEVISSTKQGNKYDINNLYIDPTVYLYRNSWNN